MSSNAERQVRYKIFQGIKTLCKVGKNREIFTPGETLINYAGRVYDEKEMINLVDASLDFWLTAGRYAQEFEQKLADFLKVKYTLLTNSGSSANLLAISALTSPLLKGKQLKPGDEVITTACGFPTTLNPILQNNLVPVFIDVELGTYNIRTELLTKALSKKTKAIFVPHTLGNPVNIEAISKFARKHNLWFIEDNCIDGERCSVVRIDGEIQILTIEEIYKRFLEQNYKSLEILSHGEIFKEEDLNSLSAEFNNNLSKRQLSIIDLYKKYQGNTKKIITEIGISSASYYCSIWEIRKKMKEFSTVKYKWSKVKKVIFKGKSNVVKITQNFGQTCVTDDHRLMVFEEANLREKNTNSFICDKDRFVTILLTDNAKEEIVDIAQYLEGYSQENGNIKYDNGWVWFEYTKKCWKGKITELPKIKRYYKGSDLERLCALFGLYCSEGSCGHELRFNSTNYRDIEMIERYIKAISNLKSIRTSSDDDRSLKKTIRGKKFNSNKIVFSVNMGHELINILFSKLGGGDSFNKKVPNFIFNLSRKYMKIYYDYYIKGDGCRKSNEELDFVITTASIKMAAGVNLLNNLLFKKHSRIIISKGKYYDISPVKSLKYIKREVNKIEDIKDVKVYDIIVDGTSTFVDACGNVLLHNCDALGSKYKGKFTGTFGHIATFSFYPAHHITMGEGGALATNDPLLRRLILSFRDWGRDCWCEPGHDDTCQRRFSWQLGKLPFGYDHKYTYSHIGYNLKVTDMQAAIGVAQLEKLPAFINARQHNFAFLLKLFKKYESYFILPQPTRRSEPSWFGFPVMVKERAPFTRTDIVNHLEENKIATRMLFGGNLTKQPAYAGMKYKMAGKLDNTDLVMNNLFWIGVYPGITNEKLRYMAKSVAEFMSAVI